MPDAIWLPREERELETDWLTLLGSSFFENLCLCILFSPLPLSPVHPLRTTLLFAPLIDGFCFQWGFQKQSQCTSCLCTTTPAHPRPSPWRPHSVTFFCDTNEVDTATFNPHHTHKCREEEQPETYEMWLLPPPRVCSLEGGRNILKWNIQREEPDKV